LRDTEQVPLLEEGGIEAFLRREVLPHAADAWYDEHSVKIGYEISFNRYFYKPQPLRTLDEIRSDILAVEKETEGLLAEIVGGGPDCRGWERYRCIGNCAETGGCFCNETRRDSRICRFWKSRSKPASASGTSTTRRASK
jgi:hypothetical protein